MGSLRIQMVVCYSDGTYPANELRKIGNSWFGFDAAGWMETGWAAHDNNWYYFASSGAMQTGWLVHGKSWYYLDGTGKMTTGFITVKGATYYLNGSGQMVTGWLHLNNDWYYFAGSGAMTTGWQKVGNYWYYLDEKWKNGDQHLDRQLVCKRFRCMGSQQITLYRRSSQCGCYAILSPRLSFSLHFFSPYITIKCRNYFSIPPKE